MLEQLYSIVNTRYEDERAMIVTTNLRYEELIEQLGERTVSRLVAICGNGLPLYGEDDRLSHRDRPRESERRARRASARLPRADPTLPRLHILCLES